MIDERLGLLYCGDDAAFYQTIKNDFVTESSCRLMQLQNAYDHKQWSDYQMLVHTIKAISALVGATDLSMHAEKHQNAAATGDVPFIQRDYHAFRNKYLQTVSEISHSIDK